MTDLTPAQLAALDQAYAESEAELNQRVAELSAAVDGLSAHEAVALLQVEYAEIPADTARSILPLFMLRIIQLTEELAHVRRCRVCGCTDDAACDGGCWWVEDDLCSACRPAPAGEVNADPT